MIGIVGWAVLLGACVAWEGIALVRPHDAWPTLSDMLRLVTQPVFGRWALFALWLWSGWHLFVRGWHFFLREPVSRPRSLTTPSRDALAVAPVTLDELLRQDILPLTITYAMVLAMLLYCARRIRGEPLRNLVSVDRRSPRGWPALLTHIVVTAACGYALFLAVVALYYGAVANQTPEFLSEAVGGGAFLAFAVALPVFVVISWLANLRASLPASRSRSRENGGHAGFEVER